MPRGHMTPSLTLLRTCTEYTLLYAVQVDLMHVLIVDRNTSYQSNEKFDCDCPCSPYPAELKESGPILSPVEPRDPESPSIVPYSVPLQSSRMAGLIGAHYNCSNILVDLWVTWLMGSSGVSLVGSTATMYIVVLQGRRLHQQYLPSAHKQSLCNMRK